MGKMAAIFVHAQQLCNGQPPDFADNENVQPAVIRDCFRPGEETAAVGFAVADGAHQAVHRQLLAVDGEGQLPADVSAELLHDGEQIGHLTAAQRDAPELRDAVGHLCVQPRRADGSGQAQIRFQQVDGHFPARKLGVKVGKLFFRAVGAQEIVAAAVGQTAHRRVGEALHAGHGLHKSAVAARRVDAERLPALGRLLCRRMGQLPRVARIFGHTDRVFSLCQPRAPGRRLDLRDEGSGAVLLARRRVQQKQCAHWRPPAISIISIITEKTQDARGHSGASGETDNFAFTAKASPTRRGGIAKQ